MIEYPYLPEGRKFLYVDGSHPVMVIAQHIAKSWSLDTVMPNASIVVGHDGLLGGHANGSTYHQTNVCQRVLLGSPTGEGYELCEGCHPKNHSESLAVANAQQRGYDTAGADLYLWGHWWCCRWCWDAMIAAGIRDVYLLEGSEVLFNKDHPDNIVGRQFIGG